VRRIKVAGHKLSGTSLPSLSWNNQNFNQGSPKPNAPTQATRRGDRELHTRTSPVHIALADQIVGGPFQQLHRRVAPHGHVPRRLTNFPRLPPVSARDWRDALRFKTSPQTRPGTTCSRLEGGG